MTIRIAQNIRTFRKERKMTQEQLAEALGVTVGAVSKWESGASTPDISLIVDMAGFFETSVDVLLGYDWHSGGMGEAIERIRSLRNEKRFEDAASEAEKALQKYPNAFDVVFQSAVMYSMYGVETHNQKSYRRSLALLERSLELIAQNTDEHINEWTIRNRIAEVYLCLGQTQTALDMMKKNNADGLNNGSIGYVLTLSEHKPDEALPYLSDALITFQNELYRVVLVYANAYAQQNKPAASLDVLVWMRGVLEGLIQPGQTSYLNMQTVQIGAMCACTAQSMGDWEAVRAHLRYAKKQAQVFDADPSYDYKRMRFSHSEHGGTAFDDFGATAMDGVRRLLSEQNDAAPALLQAWEEILAE